MIFASDIMAVAKKNSTNNVMRRDGMTGATQEATKELGRSEAGGNINDPYHGAFVAWPKWWGGRSLWQGDDDAILWPAATAPRYGMGPD